MPRWVIDTNVVVSGLLNPAGPPGRIIDAWQAGRLVMVVDDRILREYGDVLTRSRLRLDPVRVAGVLALAHNGGEHVVAAGIQLPFVLPDPKDVCFAEVAVIARVAALVTGNLKHFAVMRDVGPISVLSPFEAVQVLDALV